MPQPTLGYTYVLGFWGKAPAAKRFPGYYSDLRERWMRESRCYFSVILPKSGGYGTPHSKKWGVRVPPVPPRKLRLWYDFISEI